VGSVVPGTPTPSQVLLQELLDQVAVAPETLLQDQELQIKEVMAAPAPPLQRQVIPEVVAVAVAEKVQHQMDLQVLQVAVELVKLRQ
jgi:hypothetical protein